jgi:hypothetical protein
MKPNPPLNRSLTTLLWSATASLLILSQPAQAGYIVTLQQVGPNVVATGSGPIDLTGLSSFGAASVSGAIAPSVAEIIVASGNVDIYFGVSGPSSFGTGGFTFAGSSSGDPVGIDAGINRLLMVPAGYISGAALSDTSTYNSATFASLGVTPGIYEWTWGTGANQNFTLDAVAPTVPDSGSTFGLLFVALGGLFGVSHFRRVHVA